MNTITQRKTSKDLKNLYNQQSAKDEADANTFDKREDASENMRRRHARFDVLFDVPKERAPWNSDLYHLVIRERDEGIFHVWLESDAVWLESDAEGHAAPGLSNSAQDPVGRRALLQLVRDAANLAWPDMPTLKDEQIRFI